MGETEPVEMTSEEQAAYRRWLFTGSGDNLDTSDEGWLETLQERVWVEAYRLGHREAARAALHTFADNLSGNYTLDFGSADALHAQIVALARRDGNLLGNAE